MTQLARNIHYSPETGYVLLDVAKPASLPLQLKLNETSYIAKDELHVSLLDCRRIAENLSAGEETLVDTLSDVSRIAVLGTVAFKSPLYVCQKPREAARSIVAQAEVVGLHALFTILRQRVGYAVPDPFAHVTLYTSDGGQGIAVRNRTEFDERCTPVELSDIEALLVPPPVSRTTDWW
jgi:hypothetical protein